MDPLLLAKVLTAVAPVLLLLAVFDRLDSFNLISFKVIAALVLGGGAIAALSFLVNWRVMDGFPIGLSNHSRYVAPVVEETLKAMPIVALFATNLLGFKIDAGIAGFAVGAGFSLVENAWYLFALTDANFSAWLVRGFGTAVMHGGATALFAVIAQEMTEKQAEADASHYRFNLFLFLPGFAAAVVTHSAFNHFAHQPVLIMALTLLLVPVVLFFTFARNEHATQNWLSADAIAHRQALEDLQVSETKAAQALHAITEHVPDSVRDDVFAYIKIKTALILRAEEAIFDAQSGAPSKVDPADREQFRQLDALERKLGKAIIAAITPRLGFTRNDLWELERLRARTHNAARG
jgi:RsiW-degrading membrane proteinase PrsW (M82 family)